MQVIRLARGGRKKYPVYRIVAADKARAATSKYIRVLGHYNPHTKELSIQKEELQTAIEHGAQPSNAVLKLMQKDGIPLPKWATIKTRTRSPKKEVEDVPKAEAKADEPVADAPTDKADVTAETKPEIEKAPETEVKSEKKSEKPTEEVKEDKKPAEKAKADEPAAAEETKSE